MRFLEAPVLAINPDFSQAEGSESDLGSLESKPEGRISNTPSVRKAGERHFMHTN